MMRSFAWYQLEAEWSHILLAILYFFKGKKIDACLYHLSTIPCFQVIHDKVEAICFIKLLLVGRYYSAPLILW